MTKRILALVLLLSVGHLAAANLSFLPSAATETMPGLKVGEAAVDFTLQNAQGVEVALQDLLKHGNVALVFYRSAQWCPFCRRQLQDLQKALPEIEATGIQLIGVSYDNPETNAAAAEKLGLTFTMLSDPGSKIISAYGVLNKEASGRAAGIAHPVIFVLDRQGIIRVKLMREGYRERPESAEIIAAAKSIR